MGTYTVQKGDTLSGIGSKVGVNWQGITGYRSGNPSLIYPGEVLSYGGGGGSPAPQQAAPRPAAPSASQSEETKWLNEGNKQYSQLTAFDKAAKSPLDIYNSALESLGIADARTRVSDLKTQLMNTENLLRNVDGNVTARTSGSLVTEAQRSRLSAMEQAPIAEQMRTEGRNLENAQGDYSMILGEGKTRADLGYQGQRDKRQGIIDRLEIARSNAKTASEKRKWEVEISIQREKMAEDKRQFEANYALDQQKFAAQQAAARAGGGGGGGGGGRSGGGGGGGGGSGSTTTRATEQQIYGAIGHALARVRGSDGFVSPDSYAKAKADFTSAGYSGSTFDAQWSNLRNPKNSYYRLG